MICLLLELSSQGCNFGKKLRVFYFHEFIAFLFSDGLFFEFANLLLFFV